MQLSCEDMTGSGKCYGVLCVGPCQTGASLWGRPFGLTKVISESDPPFTSECLYVFLLNPFVALQSSAPRRGANKSAGMNYIKPHTAGRFHTNDEPTIV